MPANTMGRTTAKIRVRWHHCRKHKVSYTSGWPFGCADCYLEAQMGTDKQKRFKRNPARGKL